jgi:beta-lactamase regulating signal transducer with metallopeptidase domain
MSALHAVAQRAVEQMALSLAGGTAMAACAWAAMRATPRQSSRARFALWFGVLMSIALLPLVAAVRGVAAHEVTSGARAWLTLPESWAAYIFGFWSMVACAGLARVAAGLWQVGRVRASCEEIPESRLPHEVREILARFSPRRGARVCVSDAVRVPTAIGFFRPAVIIPRWLFAEIPAPELNQVVLHELAHLARRDDWTNLAQKLVRALLFFHPAVWWIDERLSLEREMACDDAVIAATADRHSYARCLAMLAEKTLGRRGAALAQAAVQRVQQVTARVVRILEPPVAARAGWTWAVTAVSLLAFAGSIALGGVPPLIGFRAPAKQLLGTKVPRPVVRRSNASMVIPAAMHAPAVAVQHAVDRRRKDTPPATARTRMMATARRAPSVSPSVTSGVIPAKTIIPAKATLTPAMPDVVVFTVFTSSPDAQSWNLQVWRLTVYAPAPAATNAPRKTT